MTKKRVCIFAAAVLLFSFVTFGSYSTELVNKSIQRNVVMLTMGHNYDMNPHTASYTSEAQLLSSLYEGLFTYNVYTSEEQKALCDTYKISRNKKRWTFTIVKDAKFSTGEAITAKTFRESWLDLLATPNAPYASLLDCIEGARDYRMGLGKRDDVGIKARDDGSLVVNLVEPAEHLPKILCHHAFFAVSKKAGSFSGPFMLKSQKDGVIELVKNPKHRDASSIYIPGVTIIQSDDLDENAYLYNTGKVDWIAEGNVNSERIINKEALQFAAEFGTYFLFFKTGLGSKVWNHRAFREALLLAIPYDKLRANLAKSASTLVYPLPNYPNVAGIDDYDKEEAIDMMKKARKSLGISEKEKLNIKFAITSADFMKTFAEVLKAAWAPLGVELEVEIVPSVMYNSAIASSDADIFSYSWIGDFADPLAFLELFRSDSSLNVSGYLNEAYDSYIHQAAMADSSEEHNKLLAKAEDLLLDDCMVIPIYHPISLHVVNPEAIGGWIPNAMDLHPFKYLYIKDVKSKIQNLVMESTGDSVVAQASYIRQ